MPILTWPGDDWMMRTLTRHGIAYNIVFTSPDYHAKLTAVEAGIGFTAVPASMVPSSLVQPGNIIFPTFRRSRRCCAPAAGLSWNGLQHC